MLCGLIAVLQTSLAECVSFDPFAFEQKGFGTSEIAVSGCEIFEALVLAVVIVVLDEALNVGVEITRQKVVFQ